MYTIGRNAETEEITVAGLEFVTTETRDPEEAPFDIENEGSTAEVPTKVELIDATGEKLRSETVIPEEIIESGLNSAKGNEVSASFDIISPCRNCRFLVGQLCFFGCGTPIWVLCGFLAIPTGGVGGLACGVFVAVACEVISNYGCGYFDIERRACRQIGQC